MEAFIDKPLEAYKNKYRQDIIRLSEETFENLVNETNTDKIANEKIMAQFYKNTQILQNLQKVILTIKILPLINSMKSALK